MNKEVPMVKKPMPKTKPKVEPKVVRKVKRKVKAAAVDLMDRVRAQGRLERDALARAAAAQAPRILPLIIESGSSCDCINLSLHGGKGCQNKVVSPAMLCGECEGHKPA